MTLPLLNSSNDSAPRSKQCLSLKRICPSVPNQHMTKKLCDRYVRFLFNKRQLERGEQQLLYSLQNKKRRKIAGLHTSEVCATNMLIDRTNLYQEVKTIKQHSTETLKNENNITEPSLKLQDIMERITRTTMRTYSALDLQGFFMDVTPEHITAYTNDVISAVRKQDISKLREMHTNNRTLQCCNRFGESIIHMACRRGAVKVVRFLLEEADVSFCIRDDYGRTPLHDAFWAPSPQLELVKMLITNYPDLLLISDKRGFMPLSYVRKEDWGVWCKFLEENHDILLPKKLNVTTNDSLTIEGFFVDYTEDESKSYDTDILTAIRKQDMKKLRELHANGHPLKCSNRFGESILHMACRRGFLNVVRFLIKEAKVSVRIRDDCGRTILHDAVCTPEPNFKIIELILEECPDLLYMKDRRGYTPICYVRKSQRAVWNKFLKERAHLIIPTKPCRKLLQ